MSEKRKYTAELKAEALKMIIEQGMSQQEVADLLSIPKGTIGNWAASARNSMKSMAPGQDKTMWVQVKKAEIMADPLTIDSAIGYVYGGQDVFIKRIRQ